MIRAIMAKDFKIFYRINFGNTILLTFGSIILIALPVFYIISGGENSNEFIFVFGLALSVILFIQYWIFYSNKKIFWFTSENTDHTLFAAFDVKIRDVFLAKLFSNLLSVLHIDLIVISIIWVLSIVYEANFYKEIIFLFLINLGLKFLFILFTLFKDFTHNNLNKKNVSWVGNIKNNYIWGIAILIVNFNVDLLSPIVNRLSNLLFFILAVLLLSLLSGVAVYVISKISKIKSIIYGSVNYE